MADICDLILEQHEWFRARFADLDGMRDSAAPETLAGVWKPLADLLEAHAEAEEQLFYPHLLEHGAEPVEETEDAITDHNGITEGVAAANEAEPGSDAWWAGVDAAREENSSHTAEEERGALADFRRTAPRELREEIGAAWLAWHGEHHEVDKPEREVVDYVEEHGDAEQVREAEELVEGT